MPLFQYSRSSCDGTINDFGERLVRFCACFDLLIHNGCKQRDKIGHFTYVSTHGCSVIDYCLVSDSFVDRVATVMHQGDKIQGFIENIQGQFQRKNRACYRGD